MLRPLGLATLALTVLLAQAPLAPVFGETAPPATGQEATAQEAARVAALSDTLQMGAVIEVMIAEGKDYGAAIEAQMFPGQGGTRWVGMVDAIYDAEELRRLFDDALQEALSGDPEAIAAAEAFFGSARGQEILKLEIEARRALLDKAVEEAAQVEADRMQAERDPRMRLLRDLVEAGDLVEMNVAGALSANLAFFQGMAEVGGLGTEMTEEDMMTEVWSQESSMRAETMAWLFPYLALAYQPLSDEDLKAYVAFGETPEGQRLNTALFAGFDRMFRHVSFQLGRSAALVMQGNDI
ncbi:MAG: DUF2059 domain-containing protein [Rhodobacter sp.]|nr:DUF2059 domain-containing protein [Rhodobacter sp.]